jgi:putative tricarboxylic transport membrane protein
MKTIEIVSSLFLILIGAVFCLSSFDLGIGRINAPGPGLIPLGTGGLLILFSIGSIFEAYFGRKFEGKASLFRGRRWGVVLYVLISLFLYAFILDILGFIVTTFLTMVVLFKISERQSWRMALGTSALTTGFTYLLFDYLLKCSFPRGFLGF